MVFVYFVASLCCYTCYLVVHFPILHAIMKLSQDLTKTVGEDSVKNLLSTHVNCVSWITLMHVLIDCFRKLQEFQRWN